MNLAPSCLGEVVAEAWEGGGMLGNAYLPIIDALERFGLPILAHAGTSAGAITALLRALGYRAAEISLLQTSTPWREFARYRPPAMWRLVRSKGWFPSDYARSWIGERITRAGRDLDLTFRGLHEATGHSLYVTASRYQRYLNGPVECTPVVFSHISTPSLPVHLAVLASMSVPGFWPPTEIDGWWYCDGGVSANLPLMVFKDLPPAQVLGIRIDSHLEVEESQISSNPLLAANITPVQPRLMDLAIANFNMCRSVANSAHVPEIFWQRVIRIDVGSEPPLDFRSNPARIERLRNAGKLALAAFIQEAPQDH